MKRGSRAIDDTGKRFGMLTALRDVAKFIAWAEASGYRIGLTIERTDNNGGYTPENCRWIKNELQARNTRRLVLLTHEGRTAFASDWARELGISLRTILSRKRYGWDDHRILTTPVRGVK